MTSKGQRSHSIELASMNSTSLNNANANKTKHSPADICSHYGPKIDTVTRQGNIDKLKYLLDFFTFDKHLLAVKGIRAKHNPKSTNGTAIEQQCRIRISPLSYAVLKGYTAIIKLLLDYGANPLMKHATEENSPAEKAIKNHKANILKLMLNNTQHRLPQTKLNQLLLQAYKNRHTKGINFLTKLGARPENLSTPETANYYQFDHVGLIRAFDSNNDQQAICRMDQYYRSRGHKLFHNKFDAIDYYITAYLETRSNHPELEVDLNRKWSLRLKTYICEQELSLHLDKNYLSVWDYFFGYSVAQKLVNAELLLTILNQNLKNDDTDYDNNPLQSLYKSNKRSPLSQGDLGKLFNQLYQDMQAASQDLNSQPQQNLAYS